eukprot:COSAG05_NODE_18724_length_304_cov_0.614634_2_plen_31_part_01
MTRYRAERGQVIVLVSAAALNEIYLRGVRCC